MAKIRRKPPHSIRWLEAEWFQDIPPIAWMRTVGIDQSDDECYVPAAWLGSEETVTTPDLSEYSFLIKDHMYIPVSLTEIEYPIFYRQLKMVAEKAKAVLEGKSINRWSTRDGIIHAEFQKPLDEDVYIGDFSMNLKRNGESSYHVIPLDQIRTPLQTYQCVVDLLSQPWVTRETLWKMVNMLEKHFGYNLH